MRTPFNMCDTHCVVCRPYGRSIQPVPTKGEHNVGIVRDGPIYATVDISSILAETGSKTVNHTSYDPPSSKAKFKRLSTLACASFTWLLGVSRERTDFYPAKNMPQ